MKELKIGCVVMAAGNARRFGENKLAALVDGKPLIRHALEAVPRGLETVVVTQYEEVAAMAEEFGFHCIRNQHPDWGISHTIGLGTEHLHHCDGIVYMVSDQPLLQRSSVEQIVELWRSHPTAIVGAAHKGVRGNPNLFPREFFSALLSLREDQGGNRIIRANEDRLLLVEIHKNELTDVDTKSALAAMKMEQID